METRSLRHVVVYSMIATLALCANPTVSAQQSSAEDHVAALKKSLQQSAVAIRQYQWTETTAISIKGDEKSRTQKSCLYGADGKVQKTPLAPQTGSSGKKRKGVKGRVAERKKENISASMKEAIALVQQYVPPDPALIQKAKDAGALSVVPPDSNGRVQVAINDYLKQGDSISLVIDAANNILSSVKVSTYTDSAKDTVVLDVAFGALPDGTLHPETVQIEVSAENLSVSIENSGYVNVAG